MKVGALREILAAMGAPDDYLVLVSSAERPTDNLLSVQTMHRQITPQGSSVVLTAETDALTTDDLGTVRAILREKARHISTPHNERQNLQEIIDKIDARETRAATRRG